MPDCIEDTPGCIVCFDYRAKYGRICQFGDWIYQFKGCCENVLIDDKNKVVVIHDSKEKALSDSWYFAILIAGTISTYFARISTNFPEVSAEDLLKLVSPPTGMPAGRYIDIGVAKALRDYTLQRLASWYEKLSTGRYFTIELRFNREMYPGVDGVSGNTLQRLYELIRRLARRAGYELGSEIEQGKAFSIKIMIDEKTAQEVVDESVLRSLGLEETSFESIISRFSRVAQIYEEALIRIENMFAKLTNARSAINTFVQLLQRLRNYLANLAAEAEEEAENTIFVLVSEYGTYSYSGEWEAMGEMAELIIGDELMADEAIEIIELLLLLAG